MLTITVKTNTYVRFQNLKESLPRRRCSYINPFFPTQSSVAWNFQHLVQPAFKHHLPKCSCIQESVLQAPSDKVISHYPSPLPSLLCVHPTWKNSLKTMIQGECSKGTNKFHWIKTIFLVQTVVSLLQSSINYMQFSDTCIWYKGNTL